MFFRNLLKTLVFAMLAIMAIPAFAMSHNGISTGSHLMLHGDQALFWLGQGQVGLAFWQPACVGESTLEVAVTHWLFTQGGGLYLGALIGLMLVWQIAKRLFRRAQQGAQVYGFRRQIA